MVGGLIGKDGIHGATFSSLALDETSPTSAVQIGEPITQKKMADFLLEARDQGLYKGITDNGAGGLSSSFGEMARDAGGVRIDLDGCPLKYEGLAAWEILVSESQERMSLAVDPSARRAARARPPPRRRGERGGRVHRERSDRGHPPRRDGRFARARLRARRPAADGDPRALAGGRRSVDRRAGRARCGRRPGVDLHDRLLALLRDPNVGSKEHLVRQYDHEVQGGSVVKPHCGRLADAPTDGAVIRPRLDSWRGVTVTHGICPRRGDADTYDMAVAAVDEAVRAHVALGGDPERMAALDNFCWPDPVLSDATPDGPYKMAQLVRACRGLADACTAYGLPLVSGKDSMKNDAVPGRAQGLHPPDAPREPHGHRAGRARGDDDRLQAAGDRVLVVGDRSARGRLRRPRDRGRSSRPTPAWILASPRELYRRLHTRDRAPGCAPRSTTSRTAGSRSRSRSVRSAGGSARGWTWPPRSPRARRRGDASFVVTCDPMWRLARRARRQLLGDAPWTDAGEVVADPVLVLTGGESRCAGRSTSSSTRGRRSAGVRARDRAAHGRRVATDGSARPATSRRSPRAARVRRPRRGAHSHRLRDQRGPRARAAFAHAGARTERST